MQSSNISGLCCLTLVRINSFKNWGFYGSQQVQVQLQLQAPRMCVCMCKTKQSLLRNLKVF